MKQFKSQKPLFQNSVQESGNKAGGHHVKQVGSIGSSLVASENGTVHRQASGKVGSISRLNGTQDSSFNDTSSDEDESDQSTEIEQRA